MIIEHQVHFQTGSRTKKELAIGSKPELPTGRIPRVAKMMALAIRLDHLIKSGQVTDQAELARVGHVSRARLTQLMDLNLLAPDIQEAVLFIDLGAKGTRSLLERDLRKVADVTEWTLQREMWIRNLNPCTRSN